MSFGQATVDATRLAMREDERVIVLGEDISWGGNFGQFRGLLDEFGPDRIIDMPISEALIMSAAVGAAMTGLRPVASMSFLEFTMGAMDEIVNQAAKMRYMSGGQVSVPLVLRASDGILRSSAAQHSGSLESLFTHIAGLKVVAPSNPADAKGLLRSAMDDDDPVIYLENKSITAKRGPVPEGDHRVPLGSASVAREGTDVTLITYSAMTLRGADAAATLNDEHGIAAELIDLRSLWPLDFETVVASVSKTGRVVIAHEAWLTGGYGAELSARIGEELFADLKAPVVRVGAARAPIPFSPPLEGAVVPGTDAIVDAALRALTQQLPAG
ncbi:MAG: alpha-ketoacid dehydrogenase subunit beta [bacterium]|nr:alpha-ketoacid dehydrogenase subunit beta [bacterium]MCY3951256.1 alpha-ketoacid dehydrogenase subunit beta [bacterium]MCY4102195.1 alpha-ketoacid dehydrogenase subunit beta [bacterium]